MFIVWIKRDSIEWSMYEVDFSMYIYFLFYLLFIIV